jgi:integrase/recombinase XerD
MFDQLFFRSDALTRQLSAPLVDERRQYLALCAAQGMSKCTLRIKARLLPSIAEYLRLAERPNDTISLPEIKKAATRWSKHNWPSSESSQAKRSREYFMAQAAEWLTFLNRLQTPPKPVTVYDQILAEFRSFMKEDRGLSPATVKGCCSSVQPFLIQLLGGRRSLKKITERGGKNAKKRAIVAVARKLAVLLHRLWVSGEVYEPLRNSQKAVRAVA